MRQKTSLKLDTVNDPTSLPNHRNTQSRKGMYFHVSLSWNMHKLHSHREKKKTIFLFLSTTDSSLHGNSCPVNTGIFFDWPQE